MWPQQWQAVYYPYGVQQFKLVRDWVAIFADTNIDEPSNYYTMDVIAFASFANGQGYTRLVGMVNCEEDGAIRPADEYENFIMCVQEDDYNEGELEEMAGDWILNHPEILEKQGEQVE